MVVCEGPEIQPVHLGQLRAPEVSPAVGAGEGGGLPTLVELERAHIERALGAAEGHRGRAAKVLGISERNLYRKLRVYGLLP
jgi:DNA-binding NtrC family response regulator